MTNPLSMPGSKKTGSTWFISDAAASCGGILYGPDGEFPSENVIDSREVHPGHAFAALKGQQTNGHQFLKQAFDNGARLVIAEKAGWLRSGVDIPQGTSLILVEGPTREALLRMALCHLDNVAPLEVIAVTGSVGKTTTREITAALLRDRHPIHVAQKSYNTDIGCALTILGMPMETEILILEMGCSHPGEIAEMVDWFPPTRAIITEIGSSHLEGLTDIEGVLAAKLEILRSKRLKSVSFNKDNEVLSEGLIKTHNQRFLTTSVGWSKNADLHIVSAESDTSCPEKTLFTVSLEWNEQTAAVSSSLFGLHHARNIALALSVVLAIENVALTDIHLSLQSPKGRGQLTCLPGGGVVVDDSYNANPLSVRAALSNFTKFMPEKEHWIVLGGMKELGPSSSSEHKAIFEESSGFSKRIFVGQEWNFIPSSPDQGLWSAPDAETAIEIIRLQISPGSCFLIKGSRVYKLEKVVEWLVNTIE